MLMNLKRVSPNICKVEDIWIMIHKVSNNDKSNYCSLNIFVPLTNYIILPQTMYIPKD
jgi:hypothetical protein